MNNKYEFTDETIKLNSRTLHRIKAKRDIAKWGVKSGDLGGCIETEENLRDDGNAWVSGDARVYGNAWVSGDACVCDNARVYGNAWVYGNARVYGDARVYDNACVYDIACLQYGALTRDMFDDLRATIAASLNVYPAKGSYYLYKRVNRVDVGKYASCYDSDTIYEDRKVTRVKDYDPDIHVSCSGGIHVSTPFYWNSGDTLIAVKVKEADIITCLDGKLRCKAVTVIGEVKEKK